MPTNKQAKARSAKSQRLSKTMSDAPNGDELTAKSRIIGRVAAKKPERGDPTNQPTPEEFGERGMGVAAKE